MIDSVSVIVIGQSGGLEEALDSVLHQTQAATDVLVVEDPQKPLSQTTRATLASRRVRLARAAKSTPGGMRNAGATANSSEWMVFIGPDDLLLPAYLQEALSTAKARSASFVTTGIQTNPTGETRPLPQSLDLTQALTRPDLIHPASLLNRVAWLAVHGFDEDLAHFVSYDFWLRLMEAGLTGAVVDAPLFVARSPENRNDATSDMSLRKSSLKTLVDRRRASFSTHLPSIVCGLDKRLEELRHDSQYLNTLRLQTETQLAALQNGVETAAVSLRQAGRGRIEFGDFNRVTPISSEWGADRGRCVDRYYIEQFLDTHASDIQGRVLEVHDDDYTRQYGAGRVTHSDVIDINPMNSRATIIDDLRDARSIASGSYDCFVMTQTLHFIYDMRAVLREAARVVAPGGVVLATLACASRLAPEQGLDGDFWRFTASSARRLFGEFFPSDKLEVRTYGNVLVTIAYLYGLACHELSEREFETHDPYFPLIIGVRAQV